MSLTVRRRTLRFDPDLQPWMMRDPDTAQIIHGDTPANLVRLWRWLNATSRRQGAVTTLITVWLAIAPAIYWLADTNTQSQARGSWRILFTMFLFYFSIYLALEWLEKISNISKIILLRQ